MVADNVQRVLIGRRDLLRLGLIKDDNFSICAVSSKETTPAKVQGRMQGIPDPAQMLEKLKDEIKYVISDKLSDTPMGGGDVTITLRNDQSICPIKVATPRMTPIHRKGMSDAMVDELISSNILACMGEVTYWVIPRFIRGKAMWEKVEAGG